MKSRHGGAAASGSGKRGMTAGAGGMTGGGMILRNPENHQDQWYVSKAFFAKNYAALAEDDGAPESDLEVVEFVICDDDENVHKAEDPTHYQNTLTLLSELRSADQDMQFTLYAKIQA